MQLEYINKNNEYKTIRDVLKKEFHIANRFISKLKQEKAILLNDEPMYIDKELTLNDKITVNIDFEEERTEKIIPIKMDLVILYEDESLLIVNKPPFMPVHPSSSHFTDTLSNGVQNYYDTIGLKHRVRIANRLDKDTSGIVVFAKNAYVHECLIEEMRKNIFHKEYIAIVDGIWERQSGTINVPISRKEGSIIERKVSENGDIAITHFEKIKDFGNCSEMKFILETGRTHQIRVHCQYVGHPILGDTLYGKESKLINRQALHAYKVNFIHPITKEKLEIIAPLPYDIKKALASALSNFQ